MPRRWPGAVSRINIIEEPGRRCLPVPRQLYQVFEESLSVHLILPDLLEQALNHLVRRCIIHVREQYVKGIVNAESICYEV